MLTDRDKFQKAVIFMSIREPGSGLGGPPQQGFFEHVLIFLVFYSYVIGMSKYLYVFLCILYVFYRCFIRGKQRAIDGEVAKYWLPRSRRASIARELSTHMAIIRPRFGGHARDLQSHAPDVASRGWFPMWVL